MSCRAPSTVRYMKAGLTFRLLGNNPQRYIYTKSTRITKFSTKSLFFILSFFLPFFPLTSSEYLYKKCGDVSATTRLWGVRVDGWVGGRVGEKEWGRGLSRIISYLRVHINKCYIILHGGIHNGLQPIPACSHKVLSFGAVCTTHLKRRGSRCNAPVPRESARVRSSLLIALTEVRKGEMA